MLHLADSEIPKLPIGDAVEWVINLLKTNMAEHTQAVSEVIRDAIDGLITFLQYFPPWVLILAFAFNAWWITRKTSVGLFTLLGLGLIWWLHMWEPALETLILVVIATFVTGLIGLPLGVLAGLSKPANAVIMPILDFMQTLPAFVYLIPAIPFFGTGVTSALISTVIFAMPPIIRLTALGIEQVPRELIEAVDAFGSTGFQKLFKLQLPTAAPSIRAGANQTILLSLSMTVIAAMIGAGGLGLVVWKAIQRVNVGMGFEGGIAIVILAIILDRAMRHTSLTTRQGTA